MTKVDNNILLSWTARTPVSEGQDPLGLNLRVSARLGSNLFYCITSVTPRARYYSFFPWAIAATKHFGKGKPTRDNLRTIEKAFALGCILHHKGKTCIDGSLTGSDSLSRRYGRYVRSKEIDLNKVSFAQNPALGAYIGSLVNLGFFEAEEAVEEFEIERDSETFDLTGAILSGLGEKVAGAYAQLLRSAGLNGPVTSHKLARRTLEKWGAAGGLCELRKGGDDRRILREVFFNLNKAESLPHEWRSRSLMLLMFLSNISSNSGEDLNSENFGDAVYFGQLIDDNGTAKKIAVPDVLKDIVMRWKMFYFHYYFSAALENLFVAVVSRSNLNRLAGVTLEQLLRPLASKSFDRELRELVEVKYQGNFLDLTPRALCCSADADLQNFDVYSSVKTEKVLKIDRVLSEKALHYELNQRDRYGSDGSIGLSIILLCILSLRFLQWEGTANGNWLSQAVDEDPYENVTVPVVVHELKQHFDDVWGTPFRELLTYVLRRFVLRLHASLAYEKIGAFFYLDGERIIGYGRPYDNPSYGNPRFRSALMILKDLGLLKESGGGSIGLVRTPEGERFLAGQLQKEVKT